MEYLKARGIERAIIGGGRQIALAFAREGLLDEIVLDVQPVLFGYGTALLGDIEHSIPLDLVGTSEIGNGVIRVHYRVVNN